jgi:hypothetical protein
MQVEEQTTIFGAKASADDTQDDFQFDFSESARRVYKYSIEFPSSASQVYMTGDFLGWRNAIKLAPENGVHKATMFLGKTKILFKFLVDGTEMLASDYLVTTNNFGIQFNEKYGEYVVSPVQDTSKVEVVEIPVASVTNERETAKRASVEIANEETEVNEETSANDLESGTKEIPKELQKEDELDIARQKPKSSKRLCKCIIL